MSVAHAIRNPLIRNPRNVTDVIRNPRNFLLKSPWYLRIAILIDFFSCLLAFSQQAHYVLYT